MQLHLLLKMMFCRCHLSFWRCIYNPGFLAHTPSKVGPTQLFLWSCNPYIIHGRTFVHGRKKICVLPSPFSDPDTEKMGTIQNSPWIGSFFFAMSIFQIWGFPKMLVIPQQFPWVFLLKMINLGCEMGIPPFKEPPKYTYMEIVPWSRSPTFGDHGSFGFTKVGDLKTYRLGPQQPMEIHEGFFSAPPKRWVKKKTTLESFHVGSTRAERGCLAMGLVAD